MFPNVPLTLLNTLTVTLTDVKIIATKPYDNNDNISNLSVIYTEWRNCKLLWKTVVSKRQNEL